MKRNEATWDRWVRVLVGLVMLLLGWSSALSGGVALALRVFAFFPLATGLLGWDPFYALLGFSTRRT